VAQMQALQELADAHQWWHSIDLGNGVITKGQKTSDIIKVEADIAFKYGVAGKTVLDIGAWNGGFSFEAERRGAKEVTALDQYVWSIPSFGARPAFEFARAALQSGVKDITSDVYDITPDLGRFDIVLFMGVLYHLKHPHLALERVAPLVKEMLVVETYVELELNSLPYPALRLFPDRELADDPTNWCGPNTAWLESTLKLVGFSTIEVSVHPLAYNRVFVHAWR